MRRARHRAGRRTWTAAGLVLAGTVLLGGCGMYPGATEQSTHTHHLFLDSEFDGRGLLFSGAYIRYVVGEVSKLVRGVISDEPETE